jgi:hypothetical protein
MTIRTFIGSCHCGHVRFEADIDLDLDTTQCNCSICTKMQFWGAVVQPKAFRLVAGHAVLKDYRSDSESVHHPFCKYCGVHSFAHGNIESIGGEFFSINLACLDEANFSELAETPVPHHLRRAGAACAQRCA